MKLIIVGCEYTGVTTLCESLINWGNEKGINFHLDDHFTIPDRQQLSPEDRATMVTLSPSLKQRWQQMQVVYHVRLMNIFDHILLGGFYIEEEVYGPLYYYPGSTVDGARQFETELPKDGILVHLTARPEVIETRMKSQPHDYSVVKKEDIPMVLSRFQDEVNASSFNILGQKVEIDTSELAPNQLLQIFLNKARPLMSARDLLIIGNNKN